MSAAFLFPTIAVHVDGAMPHSSRPQEIGKRTVLALDDCMCVRGETIRNAIMFFFGHWSHETPNELITLSACFTWLGPRVPRVQKRHDKTNVHPTPARRRKPWRAGRSRRADAPIHSLTHSLTHSGLLKVKCRLPFRDAREHRFASCHCRPVQEGRGKCHRSVCSVGCRVISESRF